MFQFPGYASSKGYPQKGWVAPFGNPRITALLQLPVAYRSFTRPSSPLHAKASTVCPYLLLLYGLHDSIGAVLT